MPIFRIVFLLLFALEVSAQQQILRGLVTDEWGKGISGVHVYPLQSRKSGTITDASGNFFLFLKPGDTLLLSHVAYDTRKLIINGDILTEKPPHHIMLSARQRALEQVEVTEKRDHRFRFLIDFDVSNTSVIRLESFGKNKYLILSGLDGKEYWKCLLPRVLKSCNSLDRDFLGNFILMSEDSVYQLICDTSVCQILPGVEQGLYQSLMSPCLGMLGTGILTRKYGEYAQSVRLQIASRQRRIPVYNQEDVLARMHCSDLDGRVISHAGLGFAMLDPDAKKEHSAALYPRVTLRGSGRGAASRGISKPISVEAICWRDSIYIFDHFAGVTMVFDRDGKRRNTAPMGYDHRTCLKKYYMDDLSGMIYCLFRNDQGMYLQRILPETGQITGYPVFLEMLFPEKLRISGQRAYYLKYNHTDHERILLKTPL